MAPSDGPPAVSQSNVGHHESRYSMRGAVSRPSSAKASGSPNEIRAADGTGITHAALSELPVTRSDIKMSSWLPFQEINARSSTTDAPC